MACNAEFTHRCRYLLGALLCAGCAGESTLPSNPACGSSNQTTTDVTAVESGGGTGLSSASTLTSSTPQATSTMDRSTVETDVNEVSGTESAAGATSGPGEPSDQTRVTDSTSGDVGSMEVNVGSPAAIGALEEYLDVPPGERQDLLTEEFAQLPLSKEQAAQAQELLWKDHVDQIEATRQEEHAAKVITLDGKTMKYDYTVFGEAPPTGRSLVLSLHGGGEAEASVNDEQWENQKGLYTLDEGIYLSPRAPTNTWNLWHEAHIDPMFERLIENFVALEGVNPNRVYVMGYSAGGDGVYQLGPRMADHWAAASAMAGHPNEAKPFSLRNIGFTIHVGGDDTAFDRNLIAVQWRDELDMLQSADPAGYEHVVEVHEGKGHWMELEDAVAVPWMAEFTREPLPTRVVWYQDDILHQRFYWLRAVEPVKETTIIAELNAQTVTLESDDVSQVAVRLSDAMLDLDQDVTISANGETVFQGVLPRTIGALYQSLSERGDPTLVFAAETVVQL